jgi:hypothetical protein
MVMGGVFPRAGGGKFAEMEMKNGTFWCILVNYVATRHSNVYHNKQKLFCHLT